MQGFCIYSFSGAQPRLQRLLHLHLGEGFEHVALLDVVEIDESDTALVVGGHLLHIALATFQGSNAGRAHHDTVGLLYPSDVADKRPSVELVGRALI